MSGDFVIDADADLIRQAAWQWRTAVVGMHDLSRGMTSTRVDLAGHWEGAAAQAAVTEVEVLAGHLAHLAPLFEAAAAASDRFAAAIDEAKAQARTLAAQDAELQGERTRLEQPDPVLAAAEDPLARARREEDLADCRRRQAGCARRFEEVRLDLEEQARAWARAIGDSLPVRLDPRSSTGAMRTATLEALGGLALTEHRQALLDARAAAALAARIDAADTFADPEDVAELARLLQVHEGDPVFTVGLLTTLGPAGLLRLTSTVAGLAPGRVIDTAQAGALQRSLGGVLATASHHLGDGPDQLPRTWLAGLLAAGRTGVPPAPWQDKPLSYGYQWLGVLLRDGQYSREFLLAVGRDIVAFEREYEVAWHREHPDEPRWSPDSLPWANTTAAAQWGRLDHTGGDGAGQLAGLDPMHGFMVALGRDAGTAQEFFATGMTFRDSDGQPVAAMVDYLLTDRAWDLTVVPHPSGDDARNTNPGLVALGHAFRAATIGAPGERGWDLLRATAVAHWNDEQIYGAPNGDPHAKVTRSFAYNDLIHPELRVPLAQATAAYIEGIHAGFDGDHQRFTSLVADSGHWHRMDEDHQRHFLAELGKDPGARTVIADAEQRHLRRLYAELLPGGDIRNRDDFILPKKVEWQFAQVYGTIYEGGSAAAYGDVAERQQELNEGLLSRAEVWNSIGGLAIDGASNAVPGGVAVQGAAAVGGSIAGQGLESLVEPELHDKSGQAQHAGSLVSLGGRDAVHVALSAAIYENTPPELLPEALRDKASGTAIPMERWTDRQASAWEHYTRNENPASNTMVNQQSEESSDILTQTEKLYGDFANHTKIYVTGVREDLTARAE